MGMSQNRPARNTTTAGQIDATTQVKISTKNKKKLKSFPGRYSTYRNTLKLSQQTQI